MGINKNAPEPQESKKPAWGTALTKVLKVLSAIWRYTRLAFSILLKTLLTFGLVFVITGCIVACVLTVYVTTAFDKNAVPDIDMINQSQTSIVMIKDPKTGEDVEHTRLDGVKREWVSLKNIPVYLQNAVVAIEDERFHQHYGVDWKRTVSAVANLVLHFNETEYGGSTLTQQLVKNMTDNDDHTIERKITEILTAIELEETYSKDEILQAYLNIIPLTGTIEGVGAGSQYYFGKDVGELSLAECAVLASITNNPSKYNPYTHPENLLQRQRTVLYKMYELGFISSDEYQQALGEEIYFTRSSQQVTVYDYYTEMVISDVINDLMKTYGYTESQAENMVFYGGLTIYSCENPELQAKAEAVYQDDANFPKPLEGDEEQPQAAIFVMDYTGKAVAVVGGRGEKTANRVLNRATDSMRQPGSAMKPIAVYGPAIKNNLITFSSSLPNCYITLKNGTKWPRNYGQKNPTNLGMTVVDLAVQTSMNTVPAQILDTLLPIDSAFTFLTKSLRMTSLENSDRDYAPMALGGLTNGVYAREIAAAYQVFGNGGTFNNPYCYTKVVRNGEVILTDGPSPERVMDTNSAYITNRLLQNVVVGGSTATGRHLKNDWTKKGWEIFVKTGTTQENNDVWLVGGTPKYVAASWFGYDQNQELTTEQKNYARTLWSTVLQTLHEGDTPMTFDIIPGTENSENPQSIKGTTEEATYCVETGMLATDACTKTSRGVYKPDHLPDECTHGAKTEETTTPGDSENGTDVTDGTTTGTNTSTATTTTQITTVTTTDRP